MEELFKHPTATLLSFYKHKLDQWETKTKLTNYSNQRLTSYIMDLNVISKQSSSSAIFTQSFFVVN